MLAGTEPRGEARAELVRVEAMRVRLDGPVHEVDPWEISPIRLEVIDQRDDALRVLIVQRGVALLVWIDGEHFRPQIQQRVDVRPQPGGALPEIDAHFTLWPGARIDALERREGWVEIRVEVYGKEGWVPEALVGPVLVEQRPTDPAPSVVIEKGGTLHVRPGGPRLVDPYSFGGGTVIAHRLEEERDGWTRVRFSPDCEPTAWVTAWVRTKKLSEAPSGFGTLCGRGSGGLVPGKGSHEGAARTLEEGTNLYDKGGMLVGRTRDRVELPSRGEREVMVRTVWGDVWVSVEG